MKFAFLLLPLVIASLLPGSAEAQTRKTCKDFKTQQEAQAYYDRTRQQGMDGDGDGKVCERLPRGAQQTQQQPQRPKQPTLKMPDPVILLAARVVSTGDGDTLQVKPNERGTVTIRMACIDAAERSQNPWGPQAAAWLKKKLPAGQVVQVRIAERDQYGRTVAEVFLNQKSVNLQMVEEGQAVVYREFLSSACPATKNDYLQAEARAKQKRLGFWNQNNPLMPWEYRRQQRSKP